MGKTTGTLPGQLARIEVSPKALGGVRQAVALAIGEWAELEKSYADKHTRLSAHEFDELLKRVTAVADRKSLLRWERVDTYWEAKLGTEDDGVTFTVQHRESCYRRGRWLLQVRVCGGPNHGRWGCFDAADQPERNYHDVNNLVGEAEAIAAVLLADRMERGSIEGWAPNG